MWSGTFARLYDRKKFGKVRVRTVSLSQFLVANPAQGLQRKSGAKALSKAPESSRQGRSPGTWTPKPEF